MNISNSVIGIFIAFILLWKFLYQKLTLCIIRILSQYISERAISKEVVAMVTTGKDAVKIPTEFIYFNREMPLYILNMDIKITEGREVFEKTILNAIQKETNE